MSFVGQGIAFAALVGGATWLEINGHEAGCLWVLIGIWVMFGNWSPRT